ncbi:MAG TPA: hypothetical protein VF169_27895 [Albitalea sp.]|uniref:hypothetical protein n=1 Tax=Piscinibacter sp. TaxID=1903157 RepID=UPI002ED01639
MLNPTAPWWPQSAADNGDTNAAADPWGLGAVIETQARLWNHFLDANRTLWSFYTPWLQSGPAMWNTTLAPLERDEEGKEPAQTADGIPDALESQARSWNRFLDANRSFWTAVSWPVPTAPWVVPAAPEAPAEATPRAKPAAKKSTHRRARS